MKTLRITHLHAVSLSLVGLLTLAVMPAIAEEIIRWGHGWFSTSNPSMDLMTPKERKAYDIVPVKPMTVSQIAFLGGAGRTGSPVYHIGIQGDDGTANHFPNGQWLGGTENFAVTAIPTVNWQTVSLPSAVSLEKGVRYHLVIDAATVDASNFSSIYRNHQNTLPYFRVQDGVNDPFTGGEWFNGTKWTRSMSFPILAIDTNANTAIGQPWNGGENSLALNADWRYGQTFKLDIDTEANTVELLSFTLNVSTVNAVPADDLRVHIMPAGSSTPVVSMVLIDKNKLPPIGMITVTNLSTRLAVGANYQFVVESTNTTASGYYRVASSLTALNTVIPQIADATFQGASSTCISSYKNAAWIVKKGGSNSDTDLQFRMELRVPDMATLVVVR